MVTLHVVKTMENATANQAMQETINAVNVLPHILETETIAMVSELLLENISLI